MAKVSFSTLKLKSNEEVKKISIGGKEIEVKQYLPAEDKYSLIMITLQECKEDGIYNSFKKEVYFNLNILFMYSNLTFTDKQREDMFKLYDILESNNVFNEIIKAIPEEEYLELLNNMNEIMEESTKFNNSFSGVLNTFLNQMPINAQEAMDIVNNFNPEKYSEVINFAKGIGMRD